MTPLAPLRVMLSPVMLLAVVFLKVKKSQNCVPTVRVPKVADFRRESGPGVGLAVGTGKVDGLGLVVGIDVGVTVERGVADGLGLAVAVEATVTVELGDSGG